MPAVSIILPTYNRCDTIARPIESILDQEFGDFELIVVDDGSSDGTRERVASYADPRIVYLRQEVNKGGNAARNRGIRTARGDIVCFIDSDDAFLPNKLGFVYEYFSGHPDVDVLLDSFQKVFPPDQDRDPRMRNNPPIEDSEAIAKAVFARRLYKPTPAISARRSSLLAAGLFDEQLRRRQDMDLVLRLARTARCATTDAVLWTKYWSADAISATLDTYVEAVIDICERHPDYLQHPEYRSGLSRDVARHFLRLIRRGKGTLLRRDFSRVITYFGASRSARLFFRGFIEIWKRRRIFRFVSTRNAS